MNAAAVKNRKKENERRAETDRYAGNERRKEAALAGLSLLFAGLVCAAQIRGSRMLLAAMLCAFLLLILYAVDLKMAVPLFLFFLPWSPLLKLYQGGISFYTIAILLACFVCFAKDGWRLDRYRIFCTAGAAAVTLFSKMIRGNGISMSYLFFMTMLVLFPCLAVPETRKGGFLRMTLFFAAGIVSAALIARSVAGYPRISSFITVDSYLSITRLSGFYGDPNFYAAHITACLAGVLLLLVRVTRPYIRILLAGTAATLVYCGFLSASKMFVLILAGLFCIWVLIIMETQNRGSMRIRILAGLAVFILVMLSSPAVEELLRTIDTRFSYAANISQLTTGRTDLWKAYLDAFRNDPVLLFLGEGYSAVALHRRGSHNTILQGIYQLGLAGFLILQSWMLFFIKSLRTADGENAADGKVVLLLLAGTVLPWTGLDILFFDEFFFLPVYMIVGINESRSGRSAKTRLRT